MKVTIDQINSLKNQINILQSQIKELQVHLNLSLTCGTLMGLDISNDRECLFGFIDVKKCYKCGSPSGEMWISESEDKDESI